MAIQRKVFAGGVVALGVGLAFLLRGIGLDIGTGGSGPGESQTETVSETDGDIMADLSNDPQVIPMSPEKRPEANPLPDTSQLLTVIVEERHYLWGTNDAEPIPVQDIALADIIEKARQTQGNEQGIRVRIYHKGSALPSAENELMAALREAGLSETDIYFEQRVYEPPQS